MELWLLLVFLSLISYFLIKHTAEGMTKTPTWLLWLVMMTPAIIWAAWYRFQGQERTMPLMLVIAPFLICPLLYWWLVDLGRPKVNREASASESEDQKQTQKTANVTEDLLKLRPITHGEETTLRNCFPWGVYYLQQIDYRPQAILCRGKLRTTGEEAYKTIQKNVETAFGDRFLVVFQESFRGQPFFALVPNPWAKKVTQQEDETLTRPILALSLLIITLFTTTIIGVEISGVPLEQLQTDPNLLLKGLPYSLGLIFILGVHELAHYLTALRYGIAVSLPCFIPVPFFLGTFGAYVQTRSPVPHRQALFDVAIAGPLAGFCATLPLLIWGLSLSEVIPLPEEHNLLSFDALNPRFSFLLSLLAKLALGNDLTAQTAINLHPLAVAGYLGLLVTALNLIPIGQFDGGHIVHAMFGQKTAIGVGQITRLFMFLLAFTQPDYLIWAIVFLFIPILDQPALNDVTELDNQRDFWGLFSLFLLASILLPLPPTIAQWLSV